ncbi:NHLP bacteriocin system secretion protein (plasmid) [Ensifer sp. PDNC004]|uniref:NHLP bacteriocin system secretion protein n=1 Tax=Ensifer sp. PDNC004 TaxID=2811423 RepID=UPI001962A885|nr:NHLP bacteriocin system secretion protein [Ensifer sp. PDNC004]QRY70615.1 NHLP bacteriocin system secretion protein [Ensifer sp. PDNC004]
MSRQIFRQAALDRLSSPEQLDTALPLVSVRGWAGIAVFGFLILCALLWGVFGSLPSNISGKGILVVREGRVQEAMTLASGVLMEILATQGQVVTKGQVVGRIEQAGSERQLLNLDQEIEEKRGELARRQSLFLDEMRSREAIKSEQEAALRTNLEASRQHAEWLVKSMPGIEKLQIKGVVSARGLQDQRVSLANAQKQVSDVELALSKLDSDLAELRLSRETALKELEAAHNDAVRRRALTEARMQQENLITAPVAGRVVAVKQAAGSVVAAGAQIVSIETNGGGLEALVFLQTADGKKVVKGMRARITPDAVRKEEWGSIRGEVLERSDYPVAANGLEAWISNQALVQQLAAGSQPYVARLKLQIDEDGRWAWTSGKSPPIVITSGTTVASEITYERRRPIDLVLPALRKWLSLEP